MANPIASPSCRPGSASRRPRPEQPSGAVIAGSVTPTCWAIPSSAPGPPQRAIVLPPRARRSPPAPVAARVSGAQVPADIEPPHRNWARPPAGPRHTSSPVVPPIGSPGNRPRSYPAGNAIDVWPSSCVPTQCVFPTRKRSVHRSTDHWATLARTRQAPSCPQSLPTRGPTARTSDASGSALPPPPPRTSSANIRAGSRRQIGRHCVILKDGSKGHPMQPVDGNVPFWIQWDPQFLRSLPSSPYLNFIRLPGEHSNESFASGPVIMSNLTP